jgi:hypothetical protein
MKAKPLTIAVAALVVTGLAVVVALSLQRGAESKRASAPHTTTARELPGTVKSLVRDVAGRSSSELPRTTREILELVPIGTPLEAARQRMTEHHFVCSLDSYTNPAQMSNSAIWNAPFVKGGQRMAVTNVARLTCKTNDCAVTFWLINGETTSLAVKGQF